jgi:hypothetical protein
MGQSNIEIGSETVISLDGILQKAADLLAKHKGEDLWTNGYQEDFPGGDYQNHAMDIFLDQVPAEIRNRYSGHGITRGFLVDQLAALMVIAEKGLVIGSEGPLAHGARETYMTAYTNGSALVVSKIDMPLVAAWDDGHEVEMQGERKTACEADVAAIILNSELYPLYEELKAMYPKVNFIKANQIPDFFMGREKEPNLTSTQKLMDRFAAAVQRLVLGLKLGKK